MPQFMTVIPGSIPIMNREVPVLFGDKSQGYQLYSVSFIQQMADYLDYVYALIVLIPDKY